MTPGAPRSFGARLKALRESAGYTQEELATIAGLSVHAVSALERGERRRPHVDTVRALSAALDLTGAVRDAFVASARAPAGRAAVDELSGASLPLAVTPLVGRDRELETLRQWLADPVVRLMTLTGPGGAGKTRLALELARAIADEGSTRVVFAPLATIRERGLAACAIAEAFGLAAISASDLPRRARAACEHHPTLLLLDNFEQVLEAAPVVVDLLSWVPSLRVLATSRAALRVRGEREFAVGPLALEVDSDAMSPADVARIPAVRLFVERVRDVQPDFRLTSANGSTVAAICRRLDALPLALELAAPWMKTLTADDLLRRLEHNVLLSTVGRRDLPDRQQTIDAAVAWSYQLLGQEEQRAFRRFSVLPGRFPVEAAAAVLAGPDEAAAERAALAAVADLIDKSLVMRVATSVPARPLYLMLGTVRAYAALELAATHEHDDAMEGVVRYCAREASLAASGLVGPSQVEWLHRVREDLESYRAALSWLIARGRADEAADMTSGLMFFWLIRGHAAEGRHWYEQALSLRSLSPASTLRALVGASLMRYAQGDIEHARTGCTQVLAEGADGSEPVAQAQYMLGRVELAAGNTDAARDWFSRSHDGFRALGIPWGRGLSLNGLGWIALATGDASQAERLLDGAMSEFRQVGPWFLSATQNVRATVAIQRGKPDDALAWVRQSLTHIRDLHDKFAFVYAMAPLAAAAALKGKDALAARILGARDAVAESTGAKGVDMDALRKQTEQAARARLGAEQWALAHAAGRRTSIDELLKDIESVG